MSDIQNNSSKGISDASQPQHEPTALPTYKHQPLLEEVGSTNLMVFHKLTVYETKTRLYIVGSDLEERFRILKIDKTSPNELNITLDGATYTPNQCSDLLMRINIGNQYAGGLQKVISAFGLVGFIKFTEGYYLCLITKRKAVAVIGGSYIYHIEDTTLLPISATNQSRIESKNDEAKYLTIFQNVDLSKNFYFSYSYDLTSSLQHNTLRHQNNTYSSTGLGSYQSRFVWNEYLLRVGFGDGCLEEPGPWILPLIHGFVDQAKISVYGKEIYVALIARRSRHFAGARFLKRGSNLEGHVANEVETEQIVYDSSAPCLFPTPSTVSPLYTSYLQHRGSIPLTWGQDTSTMAPKPPISILRRDPFATLPAKHFDDMFQRYGTPLVILNLIKKKEKTPRESKLLGEFSQAVIYLQSMIKDPRKLFYVEYDMSRESKTVDGDVIGYLEWLGDDALRDTQFFHSGKEPYAWYLKRQQEGDTSPRYTQLFQHGIVRTNCIDCIDRTNAAQFLIGKQALAYQLNSLGVVSEKYLPFDCDAIDMLTEMYHDHGDTLALQYGGSNLVNTMATYRNTNRNWSSHSRDIIEAIRRFYTNSFVDADKQEAMNLFLGKYVVGLPHQPKLWELPSDYYLHNPPHIIYKRPHYINWFSDTELITTSRNLPLAAVTKTSLPRRRPKTQYPLYWLEYYKPHQFTTFSRLLAFNLNSTEYIRRLSDLENGSIKGRVAVSPFTVHREEGPSEEDTTVNVVRFGKWFSLNSGKSNGKNSKSRMSGMLPPISNPPDIIEPVQATPTESPTDLELLLKRLINPIPTTTELDNYHHYINFSTDPNHSTTTSSNVSTISDLSESEDDYPHQSRLTFAEHVAVSHGQLPSLSKMDLNIYNGYMELPNRILHVGNGKLPTYHDRTVEAYQDYINNGRYRAFRNQLGS